MNAWGLQDALQAQLQSHTAQVPLVTLRAQATCPTSPGERAEGMLGAAHSWSDHHDLGLS